MGLAALTLAPLLSLSYCLDSFQPIKFDGFDDEKFSCSPLDVIAYSLLLKILLIIAPSALPLIYRPISKLPFVSTILVNVVAEIAFLKVSNDIQMSSDVCDWSVLVLLNVIVHPSYPDEKAT